MRYSDVLSKFKRILLYRRLVFGFTIGKCSFPSYFCVFCQVVRRVVAVFCPLSCNCGPGLVVIGLLRVGRILYLRQLVYAVVGVTGGAAGLLSLRAVAVVVIAVAHTKGTHIGAPGTLPWEMADFNSPPGAGQVISIGGLYAVAVCHPAQAASRVIVVFLAVAQGVCHTQHVPVSAVLVPGGVAFPVHGGGDIARVVIAVVFAGSVGAADLRDPAAVTAQMRLPPRS